MEIQNFTPRLYQETIMASCAQNNCLVIMPTGMGKTKTAILAAVQRLNTHPQSQVLFLTVTKPLAEQIAKEVQECMDIEESAVALFTGSVSPTKRKDLWKSATVIVSTPQCIENDLINNRIDITQVSLVIFDEAHNAVKDYAYTWIAKRYHQTSRFPRIIGLTASPGSDMASIQEVCKNLYIEEIEIRTDTDPDVKPYVHDVDLTWHQVELPPVFFEARRHLKHFIKTRMEKLKSWGILQRTNLDFVSKKDLLELSAQLRGRASSGDGDFMVWNSISILAEIMKIHHGLELFEAQGIIPTFRYFDTLQKDSATTKVKAVKNIVKDLSFRSAFFLISKLHNEGVEHPKLIELQKFIDFEIRENPNRKIIVFNQFRESAQDTMNKLNTIDQVQARLFVGQLKKNDMGMSQKEQKQVLDDFRKGTFNVLVATSIAEQGLDIPNVDTVIFYEPIPSAIRQIQRRGRTGRHRKGNVVVLVTKNTTDEAYRWSAHHKEKKMYRNLENLKRTLTLFENKQQEKKLSHYTTEKKIKIGADHRERGSQVIKQLIEHNIDVTVEQLQNADYVLSSRVGVEVKKVPDFVESIIDGRLLQQIDNLKRNFPRPLIIIEGVEDLYSVRNVHANAIRGMLAAITVSYGIPLLHTKNIKDTTLMLISIAKREQEETSSEFSLHSKKKSLSIKEQQEYIVSSLPGVGPGLSKPLLTHFKNVKSVVNADQKELETIEKIGKKKAQKIWDIVNRDYQTLDEP